MQSKMCFYVKFNTQMMKQKESAESECRWTVHTMTHYRSLKIALPAIILITVTLREGSSWRRISLILFFSYNLFYKSFYFVHYRFLQTH